MAAAKTASDSKAEPATQDAIALLKLSKPGERMLARKHDLLTQAA